MSSKTTRTSEKFLGEVEMSPENGPRSSKYDLRGKILQMGLVIFVLYMAFMILRLSSARFFDFDEYQVLYESASLLRGKTLYSDAIGTHFPLVNVMISFVLKFLGFKPASVLAVRHTVLLFTFVTILFTFKITEAIWGRLTGLLAVALTMSCLVLVNKGIEIRHDVFGTAFITLGSYGALEFLKQRKIHCAWLSGLFLGLAVASTQKAVIWSAGIIGGLLYCVAKERGFKKLIQLAAIYGTTLVLPLLISLIYLHLTTGEGLRPFLDVTVMGSLGYLNPEKVNKIYPFPYARQSIYWGLIYKNALFYALSICGLFQAFKSWVREDSAKIIIAFWATAGIFFYLIMPRPFHQSLLPTIPALGILAAGFVSETRTRIGPLPKGITLGLEALVVALLLGWPSYLVIQQRNLGGIMNKEMQNLTFCLENLKPDDKVLSFTQQQIFFDSLLSVSGDECGDSIYTIDPGCFERKMTEHQCKVIIFDHRARYLNNAVQKRISENYLYAGVGDILIPGLKIAPWATMKKAIWIEGYYYSPTRSLKVDGREIKSKSIHLENREYVIGNSSNRAVLLVYIFGKETDLSSPKTQMQ